MIRLPPEWAPQDWLWIGFPHDPAEWPAGSLSRAQEQIAAFADTVAEAGQEVRLLVRDAANEARARSLVAPRVRLERRAYGDIWLRDTGPIVVHADGERRAVRFGFNGWGGKFLMPGDDTIGAELARDAELPLETHDLVLEGGAIDADGTGAALTTGQCLRNPNRNPGLSREAIEAALRETLGIERLIWLGEGLAGDHTDGHVDNLARFVAPGRAALPEPAGPDDPNAAAYRDAAARLRVAGLEVAPIPSPGAVSLGDGPVPASYANFVVTNATVVVPTFGTANDAAAVRAIGDLFPTRTAVGLPADAVLAGGGAFHCASREMPSLA